MMCHAVLAINQDTIQQIRSLWANGDLNTNQQRALSILRHWKQEFDGNGGFFHVITRGANVFYVFNQLIDASDLSWLESQWPNKLVELYIGNEWGGPLGVYRTYDESGNTIYSGNPLWVPSGGNVGFAWLRDVLLHVVEGTTVPAWHFRMLAGGWYGLDMDAWEAHIGPLVNWD